jgi:hypothetical protein
MADRPSLRAAAEALSMALREGVESAPRDWGAKLDGALSGVEDAWHGSPPWRPPDIKEPGVGGMSLSPGAARRVDEFRRLLAELAGLAMCLRVQLRGMPSAGAGDPRLLVGFRLQAECLLDALHGLEREEDALALELVTTDLGAGD